MKAITLIDKLTKIIQTEGYDLQINVFDNESAETFDLKGIDYSPLCKNDGILLRF